MQSSIKIHKRKTFLDAISCFDPALAKLFQMPLVLLAVLAIFSNIGLSLPAVRHYLSSIFTLTSTFALSIFSLAVLPVVWLSSNPNILLAFTLAQIFSTVAIVLTILQFAKRRQTLELRPYGLVPVCALPFFRAKGQPISWRRIQRISLHNDGLLQIKFILKEGNSVNMRLSPSLAERKELLETICEKAPWAKIDRSLIEGLVPNRLHSYTEIWLDSLSQSAVRLRTQKLKFGDTLKQGQYSIIRQIGAGGQGIAYLAKKTNETGETPSKSPGLSRHQESTKQFVLKEFMLPACSSLRAHEETLERLDTEATLLLELAHPQMVRLTDFFIEDHRAYLVIDHVDGTSLKDLVTELGPLPELQVRELALQMCKILDFLHSQSPHIVHRDFTPENLILENTGTLKLIDFNLAQQADCTDSPLIVGKPAYMPPEQVKGKAVTQSDIYAMGATLHFLLTGVDPQPLEVSNPHITCPSVTSSMGAIVVKATAQDTSERYPSIRGIQVDLCSLYPNLTAKQMPFTGLSRMRRQYDRCSRLENEFAT
jgi:serine/threonine-protein kinase